MLSVIACQCVRAVRCKRSAPATSKRRKTDASGNGQHRPARRHAEADAYPCHPDQSEPAPSPCHPDPVRQAQGKLRELATPPCHPDRSELASEMEGSRRPKQSIVRSFDSARKLASLRMTRDGQGDNGGSAQPGFDEAPLVGGRLLEVRQLLAERPVPVLLPEVAVPRRLGVS